MVCQMSKVLSYTIQYVLWHLSAPKYKILFSNNLEKCPEEILKLDGKVSISQALTALLSASYISWLKEKKKNLFQ